MLTVNLQQSNLSNTEYYINPKRNRYLTTVMMFGFPANYF